MNNKLKVNINESIFKIDLNDNIFSIGSCFSNELARFLNKNGIHVLSNSFGTVYNVYSIYKIFDVIFNNENYKQDDIFFNNNTYFTYDHSTKFDSNNLDDCLSRVNKNLLEVKEYFTKVSIFIITLGTSVVYLYNDKIISNCHKLPNNLFKKKILSFNENVENLNRIINLIKKNNKNAKIIISVSPVRHTPHDLVENSYSKSLLRASVEEVIDKKHVFYFPAFEIVMDELRDYSCYKKDMVHLKDGAVEYVLNIFMKTFFKNNLKEYINKFNIINKSINHKIKNPDSPDNFKMLLDISDKIIELEKVKENNLLNKQKVKLIIKLIDCFSDKKEEIKKIIQKLFHENKNVLDFFKYILKDDYNELIKMDIDEKILKKYREKILLKDLFKEKY